MLAYEFHNSWGSFHTSAAFSGTNLNFFVPLAQLYTAYLDVEYGSCAQAKHRRRHERQAAVWCRKTIWRLGATLCVSFLSALYKQGVLFLYLLYFD